MNYQNIITTLSREVTEGQFTYMLRHTHQDDAITSVEMTVHKTTDAVQQMLGTMNIEYGQLRIVSFPIDEDLTSHINFLSSYYIQAKGLKTLIVDDSNAI